MRTLLFLLLLSGAPDRRAQEPQAPVEEASPRLLLIDLDDVGFDLLEVTETPFLDQLSENGRRFTRFHSSPLCSPTRARALLGAYGSRPGIALGTIIRRESRYALPLDVYAPLPTVLGAAGKGSAKVGKWHLAPDADLSHPNRAGFESYEGVIGNPSGGSGGDNYYNFPKVTDGDEQRVRERYLTQDETNDALRRVREHTDFVWLSYHAVHKPFHQPPPDLHIANGAPLETDLDHVRAMLRALDHELSRLVPVAVQEGYTVLVLSDNGSPEEVEGGKGKLAPEGVIVPAWAIGAGVHPGVDSSLLDWVDVYATVAEVLGVPLAEGQGPDSISFAHRLRGERGPERRYQYADRWKPNGKDPRQLTDGKLWARSIRDERWSLIVDEGEPGARLYDRNLDPEETNDLLRASLSPEAGEAQARLRAALTEQ